MGVNLYGLAGLTAVSSAMFCSGVVFGNCARTEYRIETGMYHAPTHGIQISAERDGKRSYLEAFTSPSVSCITSSDYVIRASSPDEKIRQYLPFDSVFQLFYGDAGLMMCVGDE
ncbi:MAG: hypothetical protein ACE5DM_01915 [Candidatus Nanoarchaeia archaeon]